MRPVLLCFILASQVWGQVPPESRQLWEVFARPEGARHVEALAFAPGRPHRVFNDTLYAVVNGRLVRIGPGGEVAEGVFTRPGEYLTVTPEGHLLTGGHWNLSRSTNGGRTWQQDVIGGSVYALFQASSPSTGGAVYVSTFAVPSNFRSFSGGAMGSWLLLGPINQGSTSYRFHAYGELPPSEMAPGGRLLASSVGIVYSDDGGETWGLSNTWPPTPTSPQQLGVEEIGVAPDPSHPYGGVAYALAQTYDASGCGGTCWGVYASDDGGRTWVRRHAFVPGTFGRTFQSMTFLVTEDGVLFAGVADNAWAYGADGRMGTVLRSDDGGRTWGEVAAGLDGDGIASLALGRDGRLYAGARNLIGYRAGRVRVWRTRQPVTQTAAGIPVGVPVEEAVPSAAIVLHPPRPSPVRGWSTLALDLPAVMSVRVAVYDVLGREAAVLADGALPAGRHDLRLDGAALPAGVYVVRAAATTAGGAALTRAVRLTLLK